MKTFLISNTLFLLLFIHSLNGQNTTFEYLLSSPLDEVIWDIVEAPDNHIYFSGSLSTTTHPNKKYGLLAKLDKYGRLIDSIVISYPERSIYIGNILPSSHQEYVLVTSIFDTIGTSENTGIVLYKMNAGLNLYCQKIFRFPPTYKFVHEIANMEPGGNILVGGAVKIQSNTPRPYFYEFNNDFDSLKAKFYTDDVGIMFKLKALSNGNYWCIKALLNRYEILDSALNIISEQRIPDWLNGNLGVKWDTDTSFYLVGADNSGNNLGFIRQFHPIDTTGHLYNHWRISDTVDFPAAWGGIDFKDKDSIFIGGTRNFWLGYYNPWPSWFVVLQTDSMLNIRWERFYGGDAYYMMGKIIATNDGGCLIAGTRYNYLNTTEQERDIIILKLNSEGLIVSNSDKPVIEMHEAIVFPNPGNGVINVRIAAQYKQSVFELFDMNGRPVLKQNFTGKLETVNTAFLKQGTYIYLITSKDGLHESGKWVKQ